MPAQDREKVLSVGSVNADFQMRTERQPDVSETLLASEFARLSGGKAANVAYLAAKLNIPSQLFAHVGNDDLSNQALQPLRNIGVDLTFVSKLQNNSTGVTMITVPPDGKKSIVMAANANLVWTESDALSVSNGIHVARAGSVLSINCEIPGFVVEQAMHAARSTAKKTVLDPSPANAVSDRMLSLADFVVPNTGEARALTNINVIDVPSAIEAGHRLISRGADAACMKLFDGGCVLVQSRRAIHVSPAPVPVVDTTGAGDAFTGGLAVALLEGKSPAEAVRFAVATSHLAVTAYGSQPAYPERYQIEEMERRLGVTVYE